MTTPKTSNTVTFVSRQPRWECDVEVSIDDGCGLEWEGRIANRSNGGFMCECERKLPIGSVITVDLPEEGQLRAEVRWAVGWRFGAKILNG